jgi:hypothetical protein
MAGILLFGLMARKSGLELVAGADVHGMRAVGQAAFLQHDVHLVAVGRRPEYTSIEADLSCLMPSNA